MKPNPKQRSTRLWGRIGRVTCVLAIVLLSSYCTGTDDQQEIGGLSSDESYLVDSYVSLAKAAKLYPVSSLKSDSLFTVLDSTIDTTRIANTIRDLNANPDRWLLVFKSIEQELEPPLQRVQGDETSE